MKTSGNANRRVDELRDVERQHVRAIMTGDMGLVDKIHADDFQLVTPLGMVFSKEQYLGAIAGGILRYLALEAVSAIDVRIYSEVALLRYQSEAEVIIQGQHYPRARYWHTNAYETRDGRWQLVWSQATAAAVEPANA